MGCQSCYARIHTYGRSFDSERNCSLLRVSICSLRSTTSPILEILFQEIRSSIIVYRRSTSSVGTSILFFLAQRSRSSSVTIFTFKSFPNFSYNYVASLNIDGISVISKALGFAWILLINRSMFINIPGRDPIKNFEAEPTILASESITVLPAKFFVNL